MGNILTVCQIVVTILSLLTAAWVFSFAEYLWAKREGLISLGYREYFMFGMVNHGKELKVTIKFLFKGPGLLCLAISLVLASIIPGILVDCLCSDSGGT